MASWQRYPKTPSSALCRLSARNKKRNLNSDLNPPHCSLTSQVSSFDSIFGPMVEQISAAPGARAYFDFACCTYSCSRMIQDCTLAIGDSIRRCLASVRGAPDARWRNLSHRGRCRHGTKIFARPVVWYEICAVDLRLSVMLNSLVWGRPRHDFDRLFRLAARSEHQIFDCAFEWRRAAFDRVATAARGGGSADFNCRPIASASEPSASGHRDFSCATGV